MDRPRIAILGLASENCTFSSGHTGREDFTCLRGEELRRQRFPFLKGAEFAGGEFLPLMHGRALPGGVIGGEVYRDLKRELLDLLGDVLPVDGVLLDLHGAMHVEGLEDAEADLVSAVRGACPQDCLLGASMDLHGNVSQRLVELVDVFSAYRTAPHTDTEATRARVARLLLDALREGWALERAWVPIPVLLPGEKTSTLDEPGRGLYRDLTTWDGRPGILDVSLWVGYVWADEARAQASVVVTGTGGRDEVARVAEEVARAYWEARKDFRFNVPAGSLSWCLKKALDEEKRPVLISDSGDNPTAGGVGDLPEALRCLMAEDAFRSGARRALVAGIWDTESVNACWEAGQGQAVTLTIGRQCDPRHGTPLDVTCVVHRLADGDRVAGRQAIVRVGEGLDVVLTERRKPFHYQKDFAHLGLLPETMDVVVVKIGYLVTYLQELAGAAYLGLSPGAVDQEVTRLEYAKRKRPMFPFDTDFSWEPAAAVFQSRARKS